MAESATFDLNSCYLTIRFFAKLYKPLKQTSGQGGTVEQTQNDYIFIVSSSQNE